MEERGRRKDWSKSKEVSQGVEGKGKGRASQPARHREGSLRAWPEHVCREAEEGKQPRGWRKLAEP